MDEETDVRRAVKRMGDGRRRARGRKQKGDFALGALRFASAHHIGMQVQWLSRIEIWVKKRSLHLAQAIILSLARRASTFALSRRGIEKSRPNGLDDEREVHQVQHYERCT